MFRRLGLAALPRWCGPSPVPTSSFSTAASAAPSEGSGRLFTWGAGSEGQLGYELTTGTFGRNRQLLPRQVFLADGSTPQWAQVSCGTSMTAAITTDGKLYTWGSCEYFSLGHGDKVTSTLFPTLVEALAGIPIAKVAVGEYHCAAVSVEGDTFTWGWGGSFVYGFGGLGHGDKTSQPRPALVESLDKAGVKLKDIACGQRHTLGLSTTGEVYSWGNGEFGRCGNGLEDHPSPRVVEELAGKPCVQVAAGQLFSAAVAADGGLYMWGKNDQAQLGLGPNLAMDMNTMEPFPVLVKLDVEEDKPFSVAAVATGRSHSLALTADGLLYYWGARNFLQPHLMEFLVDTNVKPRAISAGDNTSALVTSDGVLMTWGKNIVSGALGRDQVVGSKQPEKVTAFDGIPIASVSLGRHSAAITL